MMAYESARLWLPFSPLSISMLFRPEIFPRRCSSTRKAAGRRRDEDVRVSKLVAHLAQGRAALDGV